MPELPDIVVYIDALENRILGHTLNRVRISSPFLLRTAVPPIMNVEGKNILRLHRMGKRICIGLEDDLWLVLHLMIAARLHWKDVTTRRLKPGAGSKLQLASFEFDNGILTLTEAGTQKRASLHLVEGGAGLRSLDPGGREVFEMSLEEFTHALRSENHTLKRTLTDPKTFSGIGNAYSDEILWHAQLSPVALTQKLDVEQIERLYNSTRTTLSDWVERLRALTGDKFPEKVTAFRADMAVHGRYKEACPRCGSNVQRIRYATNETNYCPTCQTGGKLLADRALSRILKSDWPRTAEELG